MTCWIASGKWSLQFLVVDPANSDLKFPMIFHFWKSSNIFGWFKESFFFIAFEIIYLEWTSGIWKNKILGPKFNSAIVPTNPKSNDIFCCGDKFCGRPVWFIDKIWRFGNQWPVSNTSPPTHKPHRKLTFSMMEYNFSQIFLFNWVGCNLLLTRSQ